jgi:hypothetical protein
MSFKDLPGAWRKSSYSNGNGGNNCVEVSFRDGGVAVRDSKDRGGPTLTFTSGEWLAFLAGVRAGEFELMAHPTLVLCRSVASEDIDGRRDRQPAGDMSPNHALGRETYGRDLARTRRLPTRNKGDCHA